MSTKSINEIKSKESIKSDKTEYKESIQSSIELISKDSIESSNKMRSKESIESSDEMRSKVSIKNVLK